jgi:putative inorganic carbon (HCO3(-)) transporter
VGAISPGVAEAGRARLPIHLAEIWTLWAGAVVLPLAVWPIGDDVFVLAKLAVLVLLVAILLALRVADWAATGRLRRPGTPLDLPLAAFVASAALSTVLAVDVGTALVGAHSRYEGLLTIVAYALLFRLAAQALDGDGAWSVARALLLGGFLTAALAIVQSLVEGAMIGGATEETARTFGGALRATSTFGNAATLGAFLAMLAPLALHELLRARSAADRVLAGNACAVLSLGLVLTYSRAAWLGAALGVGVVTAGPLVRLARRRPLVLAVASGPVLLGLAGAFHAAPPWMQSALARATTIADPAQGSGATRLRIWGDTLHVVAARPWVGWGPDTFGLVFPRFQTGDWTPGFLVDKAHSDLLQIAATQGLLGAAAYVAVATAFVVAFWHGRSRPGALALLGGWLAYQLPLQLDFSWLPSAAPAWLLLAVAVAAGRGGEDVSRPTRRSPTSGLSVRCGS